jgi:hypothetical protein
MCLLSACRPSPTAQLKANIEKCRVEAGMTYNQYLDSLITWQEKTPARKKKVMTFPVKLYVVDEVDNNIPEEEVNGMIQYLNESFESTKIQFKLIGQQRFIKSDLMIDDVFRNAKLEDDLCLGNYDPSQINLYVMGRGAEVMGYSHYPIRGEQKVFIHKNKMFDPALVHEFGHFFGLLHTFEHISGNEDIFGGNCKAAGDKICDTPADPLGASFTEIDCKLFGDYKNENGYDYQPAMHNFMSYYGRCRHNFSQQQAERMFFIAKYAKVELTQL